VSVQGGYIVAYEMRKRGRSNFQDKQYEQSSRNFKPLETRRHKLAISRSGRKLVAFYHILYHGGALGAWRHVRPVSPETKQIPPNFHQHETTNDASLRFCPFFTPRFPISDAHTAQCKRSVTYYAFSFWAIKACIWTSRSRHSALLSNSVSRYEQQLLIHAPLR